MTSTHTTRPSRRRTALVGAGAGLGLLLAASLPLAASAHVEVSPDTAPAGATTTLTFGFHHGCDDSPTTALEVTIPKGVGNAIPVVEGGWTITRTLGANNVPTKVVYTADHPIETGLAASVSMEALLDSADAGTTVRFPVVQKCVTGQTSWVQVPASGQTAEDLDNPAPAVTVGPVDPTGTGSATSAPAEAAGAADSDADTLARWLGGAGLVAGLAALAVALVRRPKKN